MNSPSKSDDVPGLPSREQVADLAKALGAAFAQDGLSSVPLETPLASSAEPAPMTAPSTVEDVCEVVSVVDNEADDDLLQHRLDDLSSDLLRLVRRTRGIEEQLERQTAATAEFQANVEARLGNVAREIDTLRRDLLGERKQSATANLVNEIAPTVERLRTMKDGLTAPEDAAMRKQLDSVVQILSTSLRRLGCQEFQTVLGEPFDPVRMECLGYSEGAPGTVVAALRPGYMVGATVIRPAGVRIAPPHSSESDSSPLPGNE